MVVGAFPAAKLGALLVKQVSKPIANAVKTQAKSSPVFRKYVCMPPAQFYNWCEVKAKMWILNLGKPVNIPVLSEAMAIELGANLLGEGIIFIIAAGILISEYNRSLNKEAAKEESKKKEIEDLQNSIKNLFIQTEEQAAYIRELTRKLGDLDTKLQTKTFKVEKVHLTPKEDPPEEPPQSDVILEGLQDPRIIETNDSSNSILLKAINDVHKEFWSGPARREDNILDVGLRHLYKNVL